MPNAVRELAWRYSVTTDADDLVARHDARFSAWTAGIDPRDNRAVILKRRIDPHEMDRS